jgi:hypothetical protein
VQGNDRRKLRQQRLTQAFCKISLQTSQRRDSTALLAAQQCWLHSCAPDFGWHILLLWVPKDWCGGSVVHGARRAVSRRIRGQSSATWLHMLTPARLLCAFTWGHRSERVGREGKERNGCDEAECVQNPLCMRRAACPEVTLHGCARPPYTFQCDQAGIQCMAGRTTCAQVPLAHCSTQLCQVNVAGCCVTVFRQGAVHHAAASWWYH